VMDAALLVESAATGSARTTLPREARTAVNATFGSTMRSVAPTRPSRSWGRSHSASPGHHPRSTHRRRPAQPGDGRQWRPKP
jgi:hypothetical protein